MKFFFLFPFLFFGIFSFIAPKLFAAPSALFLREVRCATGDEKFIELGNSSATCLSKEETKKYQLKKYPSGSTPLSSIAVLPALDVPKGGSLLWVKKGDKPAGDIETTATLATNTSIGLFYDGTLIDSLVCGTETNRFTGTASPFLRNPFKGESFERNDASSFWSINSSPTPLGTQGETCPPPDPDPTSAPPSFAISLNEVFPNPDAKNDAGEFIELFNEGETPVYLAGFSIHDASKTGKYIFPEGTVIKASGYLVITDETFSLSLNNTNETLSLFDKEQRLIDFIAYEKTKKGVSLNKTSAGLRGGTPTPGAPNILNNAPETKEQVPKTGFQGIPVMMIARGKDADGQKLNYIWDFGDGHKSYKQKTTHTYKENGTYQVMLTTTDTVEDVIETFTIEIRSYKPPRVRIVSFVPNPAGKDSDRESLVIENREKKDINLKGFSIATGSKKLVNHPLREDFIIPKRSQAILTRQYSLFTLPNKKGSIELRAPNGKTLQKIRYSLDAPAKDDAEYFKKKGERWKWKEATPFITTDTKTHSTETEETDNVEVKNIPQKEAVLGETTIIKNGMSVVATKRSQKQLRDLLNYALPFYLPNTVQYFPNESIQKNAQKGTGHYAVIFARETIENLNALLNALLYWTKGESEELPKELLLLQPLE